MNLLVTGGSGFIGTRLVRELIARGHSVAIYDLAPSVSYPDLTIVGDVRDRQGLMAAANGRDAIFHLAAEHRDTPESAALADEVNVGGAGNVIEAARQAQCTRVIFTSSVAVYPLNVPNVTEDFPPQPYNRYGESKLRAESAFRQWAGGTPGASLLIVRPCVVFGEGNRGNVYQLLRQIQRGRFVMVGSGRNRKSMAYVGNLAPFLVHGLEVNRGTHLFNYADKPDLSAAELVAFAERAMGRRPRGFRVPRGFGLVGGMMFDLLARVTRRNYAISRVRIRKFCAETTVSTVRLEQTGFVRPFGLVEALAKTIGEEFGKSKKQKAEILKPSTDYETRQQKRKSEKLKTEMLKLRTDHGLRDPKC